MSDMDLALDDAEAEFLLAVLTGADAVCTNDAQRAASPGLAGMAHGALSPPALATLGGASLRDNGSLPTSYTLLQTQATIAPAATPSHRAREQAQGRGAAAKVQPSDDGALMHSHASPSEPSALESTLPASKEAYARHSGAHSATRYRAAPTPRSTVATPRSPSRTLSDNSSGACSGLSRGTSSGACRTSGGSSGGGTDGSLGSARRTSVASVPRPPAASNVVANTSAAETAAAPPLLPARAHPLRSARELLQQALQLESELQRLLAGEGPPQLGSRARPPASGGGGSAGSNGSGIGGSAPHPATTRGRAIWGAESGMPSGPPQSPSPPRQQLPRQLSRRQGWRPPPPPAPPLESSPPPESSSPSRRTPEALEMLVGRLCAAYNSIAVALLEAGLASEARQQLDKAALLAGAEGPLEGFPRKQRELQATVHNNYACYYRKLQQAEKALEHLRLAADLERAAAAEAAAAAATVNAAMGAADAPGASGAGKPTNCDIASCDCYGATGAAAPRPARAMEPGPSAATLLNLAACCSSLGRHGQALEYAEQAVPAAAGELQVPLAALEASLLEGLTQAQLCDALPQLRQSDRTARTQLAMAFYNRAVEQEHLQQWPSALESYRLAVQAAVRFVGRGADVTLTMQQSAEAFKARLRRLERQGKLQRTSHSHSSCTVGAKRSSGGGSGGGRGGRGGAYDPARTSASASGVAHSSHSPPSASRRLRATSSASDATTSLPPHPAGAATACAHPQGLPAICRPASVPAGGSFAAGGAGQAPAPGQGTQAESIRLEEPSLPSRSAWSDATQWPMGQQRACQLQAQEDCGPTAARGGEAALTGTGGRRAPGLPAQAASQGAQLSVPLATTRSSGRAAALSAPAGPGPPPNAAPHAGGALPTARAHAPPRRQEPLAPPLKGPSVSAPAAVLPPPAGVQIWDNEDRATGPFAATAAQSAAGLSSEGSDAIAMWPGADNVQVAGPELEGCCQPEPGRRGYAEPAVSVPGVASCFARGVAPVFHSLAPLVGNPAPAHGAAGYGAFDSCAGARAVDPWAAVGTVVQGPGCMLRPKRDGLAV